MWMGGLSMSDPGFTLQVWIAFLSWIQQNKQSDFACEVNWCLFF